MNNLNVYLKSRHDFVNQFQLLYTYKQLGKEDEVSALIEEMYADLKQEQLFLNAPCRKFVQAVFEHKIEISGSKWTFEIEWSSKDYYQTNLKLSDDVLYRIYQILKTEIENQNDDKHVKLALAVEQEYVILGVNLTGYSIDELKLNRIFKGYHYDIVTHDNKEKEIEFLININELEV
ncbi:Spo0B domain-containing protein [Mammaliicoccus sp. Dog046]|uniref:Spo0B domain-containing protein n=1 Tax=Mammaliicoccus sp. Dog046 TaxID=3034233 RepID=UPI002B258F27|nr:Spo0B domain-containing protein [Mammaliicoccus sp. Dog046]WQK86507.1 Spo0B domain-containing protein [Mammaliicoccus sp. Dog046]